MMSDRLSRASTLGLMASMLLMPEAAAAHDWYPRACCGTLDCAPVERSELLPDGSLRLTSRIGTTVVPVAFPRLESPDDQMHICMMRYTHLDNMSPVCLFVPRSTPYTPS